MSQQSEEPVQFTEAGCEVRSKLASWRRQAVRRCGILLFFSVCALILVIVYRLTPVRPCATFSVDEDCRFVLFSPDSKSLLTSGKEEWSKKHGPLRVWDVEHGVEDYSKGWPDRPRITSWNIERGKEQVSIESYLWTLTLLIARVWRRAGMG